MQQKQLVYGFSVITALWLISLMVEKQVFDFEFKQNQRFSGVGICCFLVLYQYDYRNKLIISNDTFQTEKVI